MKKRLITVFAAILFLIAGCTKAGAPAALTLALDDIKAPIRLMDERYRIFGDALFAAGFYAAYPGSENLEKAKSSCVKAIADIAALPAVESTLTEENRSDLVKAGLILTDYDVPFQYTDYYRQENVNTLTLLTYFLSQSPENDDELKYVVDFNRSYLVIDRKLEYIGINSIFCSYDGQALDDFKNAFLPSMKSLSADGLTWETEASVLEAKADYLLKLSEAEVDKYANFVGAKYQELLKARNTRDRLIEKGYGESEAQGILSNIDALEQRAEVNS